MFLICAAIYCVGTGTWGSIYRTDQMVSDLGETESLTLGDGFYGFTYGSNKGPFPFPDGLSSIELDIEASMSVEDWTTQEDVSLAVLIHKEDLVERAYSEKGNLCLGGASWQSGSLFLYPMEASGDGGSKMVHISTKEKVEDTGLHFVTLQACGASLDSMDLTGKLRFRNPYGYLPGVMYGFLPFEFIRMLAFLIFDMVFLFLLMRNRETALPLHYAAMGVLVIATIESAVWAGAFMSMNSSGAPYCCPFPPVLIAAMTVQVFLRTLVRCLLLLICLGYGIVRTELDRAEGTAVAIMTLCFLATGILASSANAMSAASSGGVDSGWALPAYLVDMIFLMWIYTSLVKMLETLQESGETFKLGMYQQLARTITFFMFVFVIMTVLMLGVEVDEPNWLFEWLWVLDVIWEVINFAIIVAVCIIWRPSPTSGMLAYSKQLATSEDQADEVDGVGGGQRGGDSGLEMVDGTGHVPDVSFTILGDEDDDDSDSDGGQQQHHAGQSAHLGVLSQPRIGSQIV